MKAQLGPLDNPNNIELSKRETDQTQGVKESTTRVLVRTDEGRTLRRMKDKDPLNWFPSYSVWISYLKISI